MKPYEKYITKDLLNAIDNRIAKDGKVASEFKGYISSMGAAVIQSGLIPTLAFYSDQGGADKDRSLVLKVIADVLGKESLFKEAIKVKHDGQALRKLQRDILNVSIALKLTLRTYNLT